MLFLVVVSSHGSVMMMSPSFLPHNTSETAAMDMPIRDGVVHMLCES